MLIKNINLLEHEYQDKFTILFFEEYIYQTLIDHLKIAYQVNVTKVVIKKSVSHS
ncbi:hypothetical protein PRO82_001208 [Candidatus Protochlamydia amoebophila]|nr:hypothetical protein [Candidatus Protochlamydia amoebophila]